MTDTVTAAQFRADFPEFTNPTTYPDSQVNFWLGIAMKMVRPQVWRDMYSVGVELYTAHNLVLEAQSQKTASAGGIPGATTGTTASKQVHDVSVGYDSTNVIEEGGGNWNLTTYGLRFLRFVKLFGAGGAYVSPGCSPYPTFPIWSNN